MLFLGIAAVNNSGHCNQMAGVEGEGCDRASIALPPVQERLLRAVVSLRFHPMQVAGPLLTADPSSSMLLFFDVKCAVVATVLVRYAQMAVQPRTVVVLMNGGAVAMPEDMHIPALVETFCKSVV